MSTDQQSASAAGDELGQLWASYKATADAEARDALIVQYSPLVKYVAGRVAAGLPQSVDQADLVSYGMFGLIDAIDKFEPERGFKFETYAINRIKGAMLDELRSIDWVPRSVRAKVRQIEQAYAKIEAAHHRPPTDAELAEELEWTEEQLGTALLQISQVGLAALDVHVDHVPTVGLGRERDRVAAQGALAFGGRSVRLALRLFVGRDLGLAARDGEQDGHPEGAAHQ